MLVSDIKAEFLTEGEKKELLRLLCKTTRVASTVESPRQGLTIEALRTLAAHPWNLDAYEFELVMHRAT